MLLDFSGTIASGGTAQAVLPQQPTRSYLLFQNTSTHAMTIDFGPATAHATVTSGTISAITIDDGGMSYTASPQVSILGGVYPGNYLVAPQHPAKATAIVDQAITVAVANAVGTGYVVADTVTLAGGTFGTAGVLTVATTKLVTTVLNAAGTGYVAGDTITTAGGTASTHAILTVDTVNAGAIVTFHISTAGSYTVNAAALTQGATSGSGTGATFQTSLYGVNTVTITTAGLYTSIASPLTQGATSGSGTGATFNVSFGANGAVSAITVSDPGALYLTTPLVVLYNAQPNGGGGTKVPSATSGIALAAGASFVMENSFCTTNAMSVFGGTTSDTYVCKVVVS